MSVYLFVYVHIMWVQVGAGARSGEVSNSLDL